jgi:poly(3-hydroxybutyrate) depolymerase
MGGDPPFGGSSNGSGGPAPVSGNVQQAGGVSYRLIVPSSYSGAPIALLIIFSGVEGGQQMTNNLLTVEAYTQTGGFVRAVLDGVTYNGNGGAGATVLDDVRAKYNIDNDRTYLMGESAGTSAAHELGFQLRPSYFGAYWANDVNAPGTPSQNATALGFAPWGQVGPGGQHAIANQIVSGMANAGYRMPTPAPYAGAGANTHGSTEQFIAALSWFQGKTRL